MNAIRASRLLVTAAAAYATVGGFLSFLGWAMPDPVLIDWTGSGITIKANTTLATMAVGVALFLAVYTPSWRRAITVLGTLVAMLGGLTLFEHITEWSLGIDTLLFDEPPGASATAAPGRMGPPAALSFLALGLALMISTQTQRRRRLSVGLGLLVLGIATLSLVGHAFGATAMYTIPRLTGIALQTATMLLALSVGVIAAQPNLEPMQTLAEDSSAGVLARRLVPLAFIVPIALGWLRLWGQRSGLYDAAFGTALRSVVEVAILGGLLWWSVLAIRGRDLKQRQAERDLQDADRRKDEFLATLAHELRNPLAPIRNAARLIASKGQTDATLHRGSQIIERQVHHMARLLEDLLDVSRISRRSLELRKERVELQAVIHSALEASRPAIESAGHHLTLALTSDPVYVDGDPVRLAQVFSNLLNNAAKYTLRGGRITIECQGGAREATVRVRDTGIGIEPALHAQVFEMFTQATPALPHAQGGLGIGLSLARGIVALHGGQIHVESAGAGQGSAFVVRLPRAEAISEPAHVLDLPLIPRMPTCKVLIVDDQHDSADSLAMLVASAGHDTRVAYGGAAALAESAEFEPQIVLLDIGMPEIDGFEVCRQIRQHPWGHGACIVAITGWGQAEDRRRTEDAGFDQHLVKPVDAAALFRLLSVLASPSVHCGEDSPAPPEARAVRH